MRLRSALAGIIWPALCGLLAAVVILLLMPDRFGRVQATDEPAAQAPPAINDNWLGPVSYSAAVRRAAPSVVSIYASVPVAQSPNPLMVDPFFRQIFADDLRQESRRDIRSGAGIIVSGEGHILTNKHLIDQADQIFVVLVDGRQAAVTLVGADAHTDLAVLKTDLDRLRPISIGNPDSTSAGDVVLAIGNPFGKGQTVTQGIVSATGRNLMDLSAFVNFLQTDAAMNEGNSGGALIDVFGNLVGVNTAVADATEAEGISFAIPADIAMDVVRSIVEHGSVIRGWIGVQAGELTPSTARSLNIGTSRALVVTGVDRDGPAQTAGIRIGDIIVSINTEPLIDGRQVLQSISNTRPGETLTLGIHRDGRTLDMRIRAAVRPDSA